MNWTAVSSVAEIFGAIAVVVSIIYLARQVKQSNQTTEAATTLEVTRPWKRCARNILQTTGSIGCTS